MSPEAWAFFTALTTANSGLLLEVIRMRRRLDAAAASDDGDIEDEDTERGFRSSVLISLRELRTGVRDLRRRADRFDRHLEDHAAADVSRPDRRH